VKADWLGIEPATCQSQFQQPTTEPPCTYFPKQSNQQLQGHNGQLDNNIESKEKLDIKERPQQKNTFDFEMELYALFSASFNVKLASLTFFPASSSDCAHNNNHNN